MKKLLVGLLTLIVALSLGAVCSASSGAADTALSKVDILDLVITHSADGKTDTLYPVVKNNTGEQLLEVRYIVQCLDEHGVVMYQDGINPAMWFVTEDNNGIKSGQVVAERNGFAITGIKIPGVDLGLSYNIAVSGYVFYGATVYDVPLDKATWKNFK